MKKTKIVCTIGPATCDSASIKQLIDEGMNIARLNGSHNTLEWHRNVIDTIRDVDKYIPILLDLPGRKIRTSKGMEDLPFEEGQLVVFNTDENGLGRGEVLVNYSNLHNDLQSGNVMLLDDGTLKFEVTTIEGTKITTKAFNSGRIKSAKGVNVPYVQVSSPLISDHDKKLIEFCIEKGVDFVGVSFVEGGDHVKEVKALIPDGKIGVISKVENKFGADNLDEILESSFGILIDRGDLGAETRIERLGVLQKEIVKRANHFGRPVIVATEMLHTMIENPIPTKAEVCDISNAAMDCCTAVMLSGETAVGKYPEKAVRMITDVLTEVEQFDTGRNVGEFEISLKTLPNAVGKSIFEICKTIPITKVVCVTMTGFAARMLSRYRLNQPVFVATNQIEIARKSNLLWGVQSILVDVDFKKDSTEHVLQAVKRLWMDRLLEDNDEILLTYVKYPAPGNKMNTIEVHKMVDLIELFDWEK